LGGLKRDLKFLPFLPRCMQRKRDPAMRKLSVRLPSDKRVDCDKTEERSVQIFMPYERSFSLVFSQEEWLVGQPLQREILGQLAPIGAKSLIFNRYSLVAPQP